jgi:1-acyl-sn-glycerol-3-phosphate acyltransferase
MWPYTWGRVFRGLSLPADLLYRHAVTKTFLMGGGNLTGLTAPVIFAGTHHGFLDMSLVRQAVGASPARHLASRLVPAAAAVGLAAGGLRIRGLGVWPWYVVLAFGLFPLQRERGQEASLRRLVQVGLRGNPILIFPQGLHARPELERQDDPSVRFRPGVAHLAEALDATVVPFGLAGTDVVEGFEGKVIAGIPISYKRGPLAIAFGAPIRRGADELAEEFTERLQAESYRLTRLAEEALPRTEGPSKS